VGPRLPRTEASVAIQVKRQALKQAAHVAQPVTATLEHLELVVEPFDKAARLVVREVLISA